MATVKIVSMGSNLSYTAATANYAAGTPDEMENDGHTLLVVNVASGGVRGVRFESQRDCDQGHGAEAGGAMIDYQPTLAASPNTVLFGPFQRYRFNDGTGRLEIRAETTAGLNYAGLRLANVRPV